MNTTPSTSPEPDESDIDTLARALAAVYWRGKLDVALHNEDESVRAAMVDAAAEHDRHVFRGSARSILSQL